VKKHKRVGIIGASGYTGYELIKLLEPRADIELIFLNSESAAGRKIGELYPEYKGNLSFTDHSLDAVTKLEPDLLFLSMGEGFAVGILQKLTCKVVDLSRDLRFSDKAVYGLPEIHRHKIKSSEVVANPGCYATACILSSLPMVTNGYAERIIFDCKSGYSGAGRTPSYLNDPKNYTDNVIAYKITQHTHRAEIQRYLGFNNISFTPHVVPLFRGILCTTHIVLKDTTKVETICQLYNEYYKAEQFVKICDRPPEIRDAQNSNFCYIGGFEIDNTNQLVIITTIDNLMKGASGQAVQNMNLMLGFRESEGLL
jgi:N-acetyl-gamma-glutamyl-phosphate reductase